jgi:hypothetical protein
MGETAARALIAARVVIPAEIPIVPSPVSGSSGQIKNHATHPGRLRAYHR